MIKNFRARTNLALATLVMALSASAASAQGIGDMFTSITTNLGPAVPLIMIGTFLGGLFFVGKALLMMKDAKENPRDNSPAGIAGHLIAGVLLLFLGGAILMFQSTLAVGEDVLGGQQSVTYG